MFNFLKSNKPSGLISKIKLSDFEGGLNLKKDENLLPIKYAFTTYNFSHDNGALTKGLGIADFASTLYGQGGVSEDAEVALSNIGSIIGSFHAKKYDFDNSKRTDKLMFMSADKVLHYLPIDKEEIDPNTSGVETIPNLIFSEKPVAINYRLNGQDCTIFSSASDPMIVWGLTDSIIKVADAPHISSMALHYERLFATVDGEQSSIWFSDDLDPTNWSVSLTEAGFIEMLDERGALKKVISFNDYVYIFRDYGITRLSAYADQTTFSVAQLFIASGKIYPNTVVLCGDVVLFLASDGLYRFDGLNCTKIMTNIENGFIGKNNASAVAGYFENKYYLAFNFAFFDDSFENEEDATNNCLIEINLDTMQAIFLRGADIIDINTVLCDNFNGVVVCAKKFGETSYKLGVIDHSGKIFGSTTHKVWITPQTDLGYPQRKKCVRNFFITSKTDMNIVVKDEENNETSIFVSGSAKPSTISTRIFGTKFSFEFSCDEDECNISNPNILIKMDNRF